MDTLDNHRKRVRHLDEPGHAHELTFSCYRRRPLLVRDDFRALLARSIDGAIENQGFRLLGFVFMPEHVHLVVHPVRDSARMAELLYAIKRPTSFRVKQCLHIKRSPLLVELTVRERPGKESFRFWQEGPGYDRNLTSPETLLQVLEYIHNNPVRRGLCPTPADWLWSSWRQYHWPRRPMDLRLPRISTSPDGF